MQDLYRQVIKVMNFLSQDDSGTYPIITASYNGKNDSKAVLVQPYGLYSSLPENSTLLSFNSLCQESNKYVIGQDFNTRVKELESGEVVVSNAVTGANIKFDKDGNILITSPSGKTVEVSADMNITVNGDANITVGGNLSANVSGAGSMSASSWSFDGVATFNDGIITTSATIGGVPFGTHVHLYDGNTPTTGPQ